jgi:hypothetical protein
MASEIKFVSFCMGVSLDLTLLLTVIGLSPGSNSTVHIHTQTIHGTTHITTEKCK